MNPNQTLSFYLFKTQFKIITTFRDVQIFQIYTTNQKFLGARKVKRSKFHTEDSQILSATAQNFVAPLICSLLVPSAPGTFKVFSFLQDSLPISCMSLLSQTNYMHHASQHPLLDHPNDIWQGLLLLQLIYSPQNPNREYPSHIFFS